MYIPESWVYEIYIRDKTLVEINKINGLFLIFFDNFWSNVTNFSWIYHIDHFEHTVMRHIFVVFVVYSAVYRTKRNSFWNAIISKSNPDLLIEDLTPVMK